MKILCVHGVGHQEADPKFEATWQKAILDGLKPWNYPHPVQIEFTAYDDLFAGAPLNALSIAEAVAKLSASGIWYGLADLFRRRRGLFDLPEQARWTAGMVVQWAENPKLRDALCRRLLQHVTSFQPDIILAHSLGSLIGYDTFARVANQTALRNRYFVSFGSQIGNPFIRSALGGYIRALPAKRWFHLFNPHDNAFAARIRLQAPNFQPVLTAFDIPGFLDHDADQYLRHPNTGDAVWRELTGARVSRALPPRAVSAPAIRRAQPERRALLVGINDYPNEADRLQGCINDVFLMSSALQECGFAPEDIRVVLNDRATAAGILERLDWLLDGAADGQHRVFYYSGHGAQVPGYGFGEKVDHLDECLVAYDFNWSRDTAVTDDQFYELYSQLPYGAQFLAVFDCCHSGGMTREGGLRVRGLNPPDDIRHRLLRWNLEHQMWETRDLEEVNRAIAPRKSRPEFYGATGAKHRLGRAVMLRAADADFERERKKLGHHGPFLPVILQACREDQYAYEYRHGVTSYGAFTYSLVHIVREFRQRRQRLTWEGLLHATAKRLKALNYLQSPALVCPGALRKSAIPWFGRAGARRR